LAVALRKEPDVNVQMVDGAHGELTVYVNGQVVARKDGDKLPTMGEVLAAVREASPAPVG
jgi:hypothetical protein